MICCTSAIYTVHLPLQTAPAAIYTCNVTALLVRCGNYICTALTTVRFSYATCIFAYFICNPVYLSIEIILIKKMYVYRIITYLML